MIILGIDLGKARTGVAVCDRAEMLASPLCVIHERSKERVARSLWQRLLRVIALALDGMPFAAGCRLREEVKTDVLILTEERAVRPSRRLLQCPHATIVLRPKWIRLQEVHT